MSSNFHANQFDKAYKATSLCNWELPKEAPRHPRKPTGTTKIVANDRGHLLLGIKKSKSSPWGNFKGTWQLSRYSDKKNAAGNKQNDKKSDQQC